MCIKVTNSMDFYGHKKEAAFLRQPLFVEVNYANASGYKVLAFCKTVLDIFDDAKKRMVPKKKTPVKNIFCTSE